MFSDHLQTIDKLPAKKMLLVAAGLVLVCQLIAMVLVADGQVEKAQSRQASQASFQSAVAACFENNRGAALKNCALLVPSVPPESGTVPADPLASSVDAEANSAMLVTLARPR